MLVMVVSAFSDWILSLIGEKLVAKVLWQRCCGVMLVLVMVMMMV